MIRETITNNEIEVSNKSEKRTVVSFIFSVENSEEKGNWLKYLVQHTKEHYMYEKNKYKIKNYVKLKIN